MNMSMCPFCGSVYDESEDGFCPYCSRRKKVNRIVYGKKR